MTSNNSNNLTRRDVLGAGVTGLALAALASAAPGQQDEKAKPGAASAPAAPPAQASGPYEAHDYAGLFGMAGFSDVLLKNHITLYQGYVKAVNASIATLGDMMKAGKSKDPAASELRRRFGWEFNGMRLHEMYFENLGGGAPLDKAHKLTAALEKGWGSVDAWTADFKAIGAMRGIGWTALTWDTWSGRLYNVWVNEHDTGLLAAQPIVLIMDCFEHAYITDYGLKRADYIDAFVKNINWTNVSKRYSA